MKKVLILILVTVMLCGVAFSKTAKEVLDEMEDKSQGFDSAKQVYEFYYIPYFHILKKIKIAAIAAKRSSIQPMIGIISGIKSIGLNM